MRQNLLLFAGQCAQINLYSFAVVCYNLSMRIIRGNHKGKQLILPQSEDIRPTADLVKESLFNIIDEKIEGSVVLDLFSGSGSLGLEALSRGAKKAYFVDIHPEALEVTFKNAEMITGDKEIIGKDFLQALHGFADADIRFNIIFLDPPYGKGYEKVALEEISNKNLLKKGGIIVVEMKRTDSILDDELFDFKLIDERVYGIKKLCFLSTQNK